MKYGRTADLNTVTVQLDNTHTIVSLFTTDYSNTQSLFKGDKRSFSLGWFSLFTHYNSTLPASSFQVDDFGLLKVFINTPNHLISNLDCNQDLDKVYYTNSVPVHVGNRQEAEEYIKHSVPVLFNLWDYRYFILVFGLVDRSVICDNFVLKKRMKILSVMYLCVLGRLKWYCVEIVNL